MNKKILIINAMGLYSFGGRAVIKGFIEGFQLKQMPIDITIMSSHYDTEYLTYHRWQLPSVTLIPHIWFKEKKFFLLTIILSGFNFLICYLSIMLNRFFSIQNKYSQFYDKYDLIIDLTTDGPTDHYGLFLPIFSLMNSYFVQLSQKPIIIISASIGPFHRSITYFLAKRILNNMKLITLREEISKAVLEEMHITKPKVIVTADNAFLLPPASEQRTLQILAQEKIIIAKPIVCISPSRLIYKYGLIDAKNNKNKYQKYFSTLFELVNFITNLNYQVILIPHSKSGSSVTPNEDDRQLCIDLYEKCNNPFVNVISGDYDVEELKGIIKKSELFIGFRMHPTISAISQSIPSISIVYGHKSHGILGEMFGLSEYLISIENTTTNKLFSEITEKFLKLVENKEKIELDLNIKNRIIKNLVLNNYSLIDDILKK